MHCDKQRHDDREQKRATKCESTGTQVGSVQRDIARQRQVPVMDVREEHIAPDRAAT